MLRECFAPGEAEVPDCFNDLAAALIVERQRLDDFAGPITEMGLERPSHLAMEPLAVTSDQALISNFLNERVLEDVLEFRVMLLDSDQVHCRQHRKASVKVTGVACDGLHDAVKELPAHHRRLAQHLFALRIENVDTRCQQATHRRRNRLRRAIAAQYPLAVNDGQNPRLIAAIFECRRGVCNP